MNSNMVSKQLNSKQINPDLFGELVAPPPKPSEQVLSPLSFGLASEPMDLDWQVQNNEKNIKQIKEQMNGILAQNQESSQNQKLKIDRLQQSLGRLEQSHNGFVQEVSEKMHGFLQKVAEQKKYDQKVQDLVDRHSSLLKGYEVRMSQLQKLLAQKEVEIIEMQTLLNETKMEISRLKRL